MSGTGDSLRILAFEPFDAGSHRAVRDAITTHSRHQWTWITRPGRCWKWRMRIAAIEMIEDARQQGIINDEDDTRWDVIVVTSLMSAADLRAMLPPTLRSVPMALYMHENQAAYPEGHRTEKSDERDLQFPLTNLTSILAADVVIWNSRWNRNSFLDGIQRILGFGSDVKTPNDLRERVLTRSRVIWPPVVWAHDEASEPIAEELHGADHASRVLHNASSGRPSGLSETGRSSTEHAHHERGETLCRPIRIVWPHRWEHDKGPDELLDIARRHTESLNLRWTILGERYRKVPPEIEMFEQEFAHRIDHIGFVTDHGEYRKHLARCDWVLSTARHEFFGIAVVEALLAGCLPWLPNRLSYTELLPPVASGLGPANQPEAPDVVRTAIRRHLTPAIAPHAVSRLDAVMAELPPRAEAPHHNVL